jgi:hypothetical protein
MGWPEWWTWELELTRHLEMRMEDRDFTELDLRHMVQRAGGLRPDVLEGRWIVETKHRGCDWEVVLEPDWEVRRLVVVTAYSPPTESGG